MKKEIMRILLSVFFVIFGIGCIARAVVGFNTELIGLFITGIFFVGYGLSSLGPEEEVE